MNLLEPTLSRRMARVVQTMDLDLKARFIEAVKMASSEDQIFEPYRSYLKNGYKPDKVISTLQGEK
jgi:hypothetical protein